MNQMTGNAAIGDHASGAEIVAAITAEAARRGIPVSKFAAPMSKIPQTWLRQVAAATKPKSATIARVRALLAGQDVPPAPTSNLPNRRAAACPARTGAEPSALAPIFEPIDREPCFMCGTRGDIGCSCRKR